MMRERDDYDDYMDALVIRMSRAVDGVEMLDVACASAMMLAYAIMDIDKREEILERMNEFIRHIWSLKKDVPRH